MCDKVIINEMIFPWPSTEYLTKVFGSIPDNIKTIQYMNFLRTQLSEMFFQKRKKQYLQSKKLLRVILHEKYDLTSRLGDNHIFPIDLPNEKIFHIKPYENEYIKLGPTLRKYNELFLKKYREMEEELSPSIPSFMNKDTSTQIKYINWLIFSLMYIYYDGRDFEKNRTKSDGRLPKRNSIASPFSYKLVLKYALKLFPDDNIPQGFNGRSTVIMLKESDLVVYTMVQLMWIDKVFKFFKINKMCHVKDECLSDEFMQFICDKINLKYVEVIGLKDYLKKSIFENDEFVEYCIKVDCCDPFTVFKEIFEHYLKEFSMCMKNAQWDIDYRTGFRDTGIPLNKIELSDLLEYSKKVMKGCTSLDKPNISCFDDPEYNFDDDFLNCYGFELDELNKYFYHDRTLLKKYLNSFMDNDRVEAEFMNEKELHIKYLNENEAPSSLKYLSYLFKMARKTLPNFKDE